MDQTNTMGTVWLGLTLGCAQCHDHKYDPLSQKEYYQFLSFFNQTQGREMDAPLAGEMEPYRKEFPRYRQQRKELLDNGEVSVPRLQARWETMLLEAMEHPGKTPGLGRHSPGRHSQRAGPGHRVVSVGSRGPHLAGKRPGDPLLLQVPRPGERQGRGPEREAEGTEGETGRAGGLLPRRHAGLRGPGHAGRHPYRPAGGLSSSRGRGAPRHARMVASIPRRGRTAPAGVGPVAGG